jgi:hypothetical protein
MERSITANYHIYVILHKYLIINKLEYEKNELLRNL